MFKVMTLNKIAAIGTNNFDKSKYEVCNSIADPDAIGLDAAFPEPPRDLLGREERGGRTGGRRRKRDGRHGADHRSGCGARGVPRHRRGCP